MELKNRFSLMLTAGLLLASCATQQQRAERRAQTATAVTEMTARRQWHINVTAMNTVRYGTRMVTPDFFLELRGDTLNSYLPYMGQIFVAPMETNERGLNFELPVRNFSASQPKPHLSRMEMDVTSRTETFHYVVDIDDTGKAFIRVLSHNRDAISFDGDCSLP